MSEGAKGVASQIGSVLRPISPMAPLLRVGAFQVAENTPRPNPQRPCEKAPRPAPVPHHNRSFAAHVARPAVLT